MRRLLLAMLCRVFESLSASSVVVVGGVLYSRLASCLICAGSGDGSAGSSPLRLPTVEGGDEDDELYQDMAS